MRRKKYNSSRSRLSFYDLIEGTKFNYDISTKIMDSLDSRSSSIITLSTSLALLTSGVLLFILTNILNSPSDRLYKFYLMTIIICVITIIFHLSSILLCSHSYKPKYFVLDEKKIIFIKKPEIPSFNELSKFWMKSTKSSLINNILEETLGKYKMAERKANLLDKALKLQVFGVITFTIGSIFIFLIVMLY